MCGYLTKRLLSFISFGQTTSLKPKNWTEQKNSWRTSNTQHTNFSNRQVNAQKHAYCDTKKDKEASEEVKTEEKKVEKSQTSQNGKYSNEITVVCLINKRILSEQKMEDKSADEKSSIESQQIRNIQLK